ncbi:MAG: hypothetical protein NZ908_02475 [Candidatus Micrarchaeota archaeon]|nr:hypothetical protein [Candidatus Micrarchaeota archaeon]
MFVYYHRSIQPSPYQSLRLGLRFGIGSSQDNTYQQLSLDPNLII